MGAVMKWLFCGNDGRQLSDARTVAASTLDSATDWQLKQLQNFTTDATKHKCGEDSKWKDPPLGGTPLRQDLSKVDPASRDYVEAAHLQAACSSSSSSSTSCRHDCGVSASDDSHVAEHTARLHRAAASHDPPARPMVWPVPLFTPFALITEPLERPGDFRGRPVAFILEQVRRQMGGGGGSNAPADADAGSGSSSPLDPEILHGALTELERLSFKKTSVKQLAQLDAVPVLARVLRDGRQDTACKAAVVLWNCAFQLPACISAIKATDVTERLAVLVQADVQAARYAASGCLSVLTAASHSVRLRCAAVPGCLQALASCLALADTNVQYHAGGSLYYIALNEPGCRPAVRAAGAQPAFERLLREKSNPNVKLARRALACLQQQ